MTSGSLTGYPYSAPDCDHMLRKSCGRTACHRRCPTHPPLPASSHPPGPSRASTATWRRPPVVLRLRTVADMPLCQCAGDRQNLFEIAKTFHHPSQHCHQLAALLDHIVGKHCLHLRGDVEQTIIKQHGRGFRSQCNFGKTVLNQCDLFRRHCNPPRARSYRRETLPSSAGRCRTDDHKTARPRLPKSVQLWQNCPEPVRLVSASLQSSTRSNLVVKR